MKLRSKTKISTIVFNLMLILSATLMTLPSAIAQGPPPITKQAYAYIGLIPDIVGVNEPTLLHIGITDQAPGTDFFWEGITVTVTKPNMETETLGPFTTDSTGGTGSAYTPNQVGVYTFQTHFPEHTVPFTYFDFTMGLVPAGSTFLASDSEVVSLTVTAEPSPTYPENALPTEFWSRPIDGQLREWSEIAGNWLGVPRTTYNPAPFNDAPETSHILWAKPLTTGGLAGGYTGEHGMEDGDAYEGKWQNSVIMNGILYYNKHGTEIFGRNMNPALGVVAVDLRTGEELWTKEGIQLSFGQLYYFDSWNYHGVYDYLWEVQGSTWNAYDPFTSDWMWSMTGVPSGERITGPNGEILIVVTDFTNGWMALWNQTKLGLQEAAKDFFDPSWARGSWGRNIEGKTVDASTAYSWNVTIPTNLPLGMGGALSASMYVVDDRVVGAAITPTRDTLSLWALSLQEGQQGQVLFNSEWTTPTSWQQGLNVIYLGGHTEYGPGGVITFWNKEERKHYGFSLDDGDYLWVTDESEHYLQALSVSDFPVVNDKLYSIGVSGILYCYDVKTGNIVWTYEMEDQYSEYLFGNNWWGYIPFITDGKVYIGHFEHSPIDPKPRGAPFVCLDENSGEVIWRADGLFRQTEWGGAAIIGDSIIATMDTYDQRIYAIGKGPTETTVDAPLTALEQGKSVIIRGTVMDISAGTESSALKARFPAGVPVVSDNTMNEWMLYVYKQFEAPADFEGVNVFIKVQDPNGDYYSETVTTDENGVFSMMWAPSIVGEYKVTAIFEGSKAYYSSEATTTFGVDAAPATTGYQGPSADEIATRTVNMMPQFPYVPTAEEIAADAAQRTINMLPPYPQSNPCPEIPAYQTIDLVVIVLVVVVVVIGLYCCFMKKQK